MAGLLSPQIYPNSSWGTRPDGSAKGLGWSGPIRMPISYADMQNGQFTPNYMTELSANIDGIEFPLVYPGISQEEIEWLRKSQEPTYNMLNKAFNNAVGLLNQGKSAFKE